VGKQTTNQVADGLAARVEIWQKSVEQRVKASCGARNIRAVADLAPTLREVAIKLP
jgi:hypothetical protein